MIQAWPEEKDGQAGYAVKYSDDYTSWSPKDVFEKSYYPMGFVDEHENNSKITLPMVDQFVSGQPTMVQKVGDKTCVVQKTTITGMELTNHAACVDPANYDPVVGEAIASKKIMDEVWFGLGFVLQWAKNGLKR